MAYVLFLVLVVNSDWFQILQSYMLLEVTSFQDFPGSSFDRLQYAKTDTAKNWSQGRPNVHYVGFPLGGVPLYVHSASML